MINYDEFAAALPPHAVSCLIHHNPHRELYQSVEQYTEDADAWVSEDERQRSIDTDELWELRWYPDTPVSFHRRHASTLQSVMERSYARAEVTRHDYADVTEYDVREDA